MIRTVVAVVDDMFFISKIRETAKALGIVVLFPRTGDALRQTIAQESPNLILVDLHNSKTDPFALAEELKGNDRMKEVPLVAFFSHVATEVRQKALNAGFDEILPRSLFARDLAGILAGDSHQGKA